MQLEFDIYPGQPNHVALVLTHDGQPLPDHTVITRLAVYVGATRVDSQTTPELFDLTRTDHIIIKLGARLPALTVGRYECVLLVYDSGKYAGGWVWRPRFIVNVKALPGS